MDMFEPRKATQLLNLIAIAEGGTVSKLKANKLVWLCDRLHLRLYGRTLTGDSYYAMKLGPVPSGTHRIASALGGKANAEALAYAAKYIARQGSHDIASIAPFVEDDDEFSESDHEVFQKVMAAYGHLSKYQLSKVSHLYDEWFRHEYYLQFRTRVKMDFEDFFWGNPEDNDVFNQDHDRLRFSRSSFLEQARIFGWL